MAPPLPVRHPRPRDGRERLTMAGPSPKRTAVTPVPYTLASNGSPAAHRGRSASRSGGHPRCASHGTGRSHDDGSDRAGTHDRTAAWRAGMDRGALGRQLGQRLPPGKPGPKPRMDQAATAAAVRTQVNCRRNSYQHGRASHWRQCRRRTFGTASESDQCLGAQRGKGLASADSLTSSRRIVTYMVT